MINQQRPNTGIEDDLLCPDIILCCGEDWNELQQALRSVTGETALRNHEYRACRVSTFRQFSLIWTGMGTGCLEPLLYELSTASLIQNLVLIGTAGSTATNQAAVGEVYVVQNAFLGGSAVQLPTPARPLVPRFPETRIARTRLRGASVVSTDYYYGFSRSPGTARLRNADAVLASAVNTLLDRVDLVDMETAQFYHFCDVLFPDRLNYVAVKGAANPVTDPASQTTHSLAVLSKAMAAAFVLLEK